MKKKSTSQSAFLNLRVLFGLFVMLAGIFLALFATANPSGFGPNPATVLPKSQGVTTREEMARTLGQALGPIPACVAGSEMFNDVPASSPFCPFIEELSRRGITGGCAPGLFCPGDPVTRQQMAAFLVKVVASEPFHLVGAAGEPPFQNGWANNPGPIFSTAGFFKDPLGIVHLKGTLNAGPSGLTAFTLPEGYRPAESLITPLAVSSPGIAFMRILSDGQVQPVQPAGAAAAFEGLSFRVDP
jgi:S-layer homology domain